MNAPNVLGGSPLLSERLWQSLASSAVRKVQLSHDLTDQDTADHIGCCAATVGNARNMSGQLAGRTLFNLLRVDPMALEGFLQHFGRRSVPVEAKCDTDALVSTSGAVHKLAAVQAATSPGGKAITDGECLDIEPDLDAAIEALCSLKVRCETIRRARAA